MSTARRASMRADVALKRCFPPVVDGDTRVLILGSLPGDASLAQSQYYAHPQNRFWELLGETLGVALRALPYEARLEALLAHRVGLWDVIAEASRDGSLDSAIRGHLGNDLLTLLASLPRLDTVAFNGGTAAKLGEKALGAWAERYRIVRLPSSSAAFAGMPYADKLRAWRALQDAPRRS